MPQDDFCAIDFGTSNSALAVSYQGESKLVPLEGERTNLPTALFYPAEPGEDIKIGRAAVEAYLDFDEGRLLRSIKSVLGSTLMDQNTELGNGRVQSYTQVIAEFLVRIKHRAEKQTDRKLHRVLLGRPAFFVDDDPHRDQQAQASLEEAAKLAGFREVAFELEPVAAAFAFSKASPQAQTALVADFGGGTSDFSVIQISAKRTRVLASYGVHVAGTDFDRQVSLAKIMPLFGLGASNTNGTLVPNSVYRELATWHMVNSLYARKSKAALWEARDMYGGKLFFARLYKAIEDKLGHQLLNQAELAKINAAQTGSYMMQFDDVEKGLQALLDADQLARAIKDQLAAIAQAGLHTLKLAQIKPEQIDVVFFTGGSSGLASLREQVMLTMPKAKELEGERFESVAMGLGQVAAQRWMTA